mgnify:FL=1
MRTPKDLARRSANHLIVFLACPFDSPEQPGRAEDLFRFVQSVCDEIGHSVGAQIECVRADRLSAPGTIHADIWKHLELADALLFDVTGANGNVLMELGVAASCRSQDNVVILRDMNDVPRSNFLFDIAPSRHILYARTLTGSMEFRRRFAEALVHALTPAPYRPQVVRGTQFPLRVNLGRDGDCIDLLSPPMMHRRPVTDGLEFGSLYFFQHSWLTVGDGDHRFMRVRASMRFSDRPTSGAPGDAWVGVALRSEHFFANYSHLVYLRPDGSVRHTRPLSEAEYEDVPVGVLRAYDPSTFVRFDVAMDARRLRLRVGRLHQKIDLTNAAQAPHVRTAGKIRLQTHKCRAVLGKLHVEVSE